MISFGHTETIFIFFARGISIRCMYYPFIDHLHMLGNWLSALQKHSQQLDEVGIIIPFCRWENWDLERFINLLKATQLINCRARIQIQIFLTANSPSTLGLSHRWPKAPMLHQQQLAMWVMNLDKFFSQKGVVLCVCARVRILDHQTPHSPKQQWLKQEKVYFSLAEVWGYADHGWCEDLIIQRPSLLLLCCAPIFPVLPSSQVSDGSLPPWPHYWSREAGERRGEGLPSPSENMSQ